MCGHALMCKCTSATRAVPPSEPAACQQSLCIALGRVGSSLSLKGISPGAGGDCVCLGMHQCVLCRWQDWVSAGELLKVVCKGCGAPGSGPYRLLRSE